MKKKVKFLIIILILILLFLILKSTYSKYKSEATGDAITKIGVWEIFVNGEDISKASDTSIKFKIDTSDVEWNGRDEENVRSNKVVPGMEGTYTIRIDPKKTDTSLKYTLDLDATSLKETNLQITNIELDEGKRFNSIEKINVENDSEETNVSTSFERLSTDGKDKYKVTRIKRLADERKNPNDSMSIDTIIISVKWNETDDPEKINEFDKVDSEVASKVYADNEKKIGELPVTINAIQYMDE